MMNANYEPVLLLMPEQKYSPDVSADEVLAASRSKAARIAGLPQDVRFSFFRRSVDARKKNDILLVYRVAVRGCFTKHAITAFLKAGFQLLEEAGISVSKGNVSLDRKPVVIGAGPAGLFCALMLAEHGYAPVVIERGEDVDDRAESVRRFMEYGILNTESNIQFGAGGAGTFSDGKLMTRISDPAVSYIMKKFTQFGAPEDILWQAKPHVGTDLLRVVIKNMVTRIKQLGGSFMFRTALTEIHRDKCVISTTAGEMPYGVLVLATGNSARDTYTMLVNAGFDIEPKPFSVGVRIEHLRQDVNESMYGSFAGHPSLGQAEYQLSFDTKNRGVYTFCMCPGGEVIAAASESCGVCVNGMSYHARAGVNSNSAIVVSVRPEDYQCSPMAAINYGKRIEQAAFAAAGGDYSAPISTVGDFLDGKYTHEPDKVMPTYMAGRRCSITDHQSYLPSFVTEQLRRGIVDFSRRIACFADKQAILCGPETRTSAPIRVVRSAERVSTRFHRVYPCGEGAGYAGGITSAAADGIHTAIAIMSKFAPNKD